VLFIETSGCLPMCGHGTIGTITMGLENGLITPREPGRLSIDAPAGKVDISYVQEGRFVEEVRLTNVPAFCMPRG
jgi:4-hydroxyproline epimerase